MKHHLYVYAQKERHIDSTEISIPKNQILFFKKKSILESGKTTEILYIHLKQGSPIVLENTIGGFHYRTTKNFIEQKTRSAYDYKKSSIFFIIQILTEWQKQDGTDMEIFFFKKSKLKDYFDILKNKESK